MISSRFTTKAQRHKEITELCQFQPNVWINREVHGNECINKRFSFYSFFFVPLCLCGEVFGFEDKHPQRSMSVADSPSEDRSAGTEALVVAVCISPGGVPKTPVDGAEVTVDGLAGDGRDHAKHRRPDRAVSIQDIELLEDLKAEGYAIDTGTIGENLTVRGLNVQQLKPGDRLRFENGPVLELAEPRKPCFVLDQIHPDLKNVIVGRCGYMASVVQAGRLEPGQHITVEPSQTG